MSISKRIGIHRLLHSHEWPEIDRWIRTCHAARHKVPMKKYKECYESLLEHFPRQSVLRIKFDLWYWEGKWHLSLLHGRNYPGANPRRAILLKLYPGQQISETEALARWLVWVAERYGTEWSAIWNQWKKEWATRGFHICKFRHKQSARFAIRLALLDRTGALADASRRDPQLSRTPTARTETLVRVGSRPGRQPAGNDMPQHRDPCRGDCRPARMPAPVRPFLQFQKIRCNLRRGFLHSRQSA